MLCQNCGRKYKGKQCPECGQPASETEIQRGRMMKNRVIGGIAILVVSLIATGCTISQTSNHTDNVSDSDSSNTQVEGVASPDAADSSDLDDRNTFKAEVLDIITGYGLPENSEIVVTSNRVEISVPTEYSIDTMPDNWSTILEEAESTGASIQDEIPDYTIVLMYNDVADNILMTIMSGECKYNAFKIEEEPVEEDDDNPPTITLAEYNQIENGMSYFQVCEIIGGYGEQLSETDLGLGYEYATEMYSWDGEGSIGANANVMFQGGEVISKAQVGLE